MREGTHGIDDQSPTPQTSVKGRSQRKKSFGARCSMIVMMAVIVILILAVVSDYLVERFFK